jgi:hypothetical protein
VSERPAIQSSGPAQPTENPAQSTPNKDAAAPEGPRREENKQDSPSADFAALINAIAAEGKANRAEEKREDRGKAIRDWLTLIFVIATTCGVFYQAHIFGQQRDEMHVTSEQTNQLIENNAKLAIAAAQQAEATVKQADATNKQAVAMGEAATVSRDNMIAANRAWVGPSNASFAAEPSVGKAVDVTISYQNTGREPALNFINFSRPLAGTPEDEKTTIVELITNYLEACKSYQEWNGGSVVYPSTGFSSYNLSLKIPDDLTDDAVIKGDKLIYLQGCFLYRSFGLPRHSYFCYFYKQGFTKIGNLNICNSGHYAD